MELNNNIPIYIQVAEDIKKKIVTGEIRVGDKLPSNSELAFIYKINPNTVQRICKQLESEGICYTKRGIGIFIMENENLVQEIKTQMVTEIVTEFMEKMKSLNFSDDEILSIIKNRRS